VILFQVAIRCFFQKELDTVASMWNAHVIRPSRNSVVPSGRPNLMFTAAALWGATDKLCPVSEEDIEVCTTEAVFRSTIPCDADVYRLCISILRRDGLHPSALDNTGLRYLFLYLKREINALLR
jgi:hypothetical protein